MKWVREDILQDSKDMYIKGTKINSILSRNWKAANLYKVATAAVDLDIRFPTQHTNQGIGFGNFTANPTPSQNCQNFSGVRQGSFPFPGPGKSGSQTQVFLHRGHVWGQGPKISIWGNLFSNMNCKTQVLVPSGISSYSPCQVLLGKVLFFNQIWDLWEMNQKYKNFSSTLMG